MRTHYVPGSGLRSTSSSHSSPRGANWRARLRNDDGSSSKSQRAVRVSLESCPICQILEMIQKFENLILLAKNRIFGLRTIFRRHIGLQKIWKDGEALSNKLFVCLQSKLRFPSKVLKMVVGNSADNWTKVKSGTNRFLTGLRAAIRLLITWAWPQGLECGTKGLGFSSWQRCWRESMCDQFLN
jgi:hypothetical protein